MDDFIGEINREMRAERWRGLWKRYGMYVVGAAALVVVAVAGREGLNAWQNSTRSAAADAYLAAITAPDNGALLALGGEGGEGYPMLARFTHAGRLAESGNLAGAEAAYLALADDSGVDEIYRDAALLLSVMNSAPGTPADERKARLEKITGADSPWRFLGYEMLIGIAIEQNDLATARETINILRGDSALPADTEQRLRTIETVIGTDG